MVFFLLKHYIYLLLSAGIIYTTGRSLLFLFRMPISYFNPIGKGREPSFYLPVFLSLLCGIIFWVLVYSFYCTGFKTVHIFFPVLFVFLFIEAKQQGISFSEHRRLVMNKYLSIKRIAGLLILLLLIFTWFVSILVKPGVFPYWIQDNDMAYYACISRFLSQTGQENTFGINNLLSGEIYHGVTPYHYFELWLNSLFTNTSRSLHLLSLFLFTYPLLNFINVLGLFAVLEMQTRVTVVKQMITTLLLFMGGMYFYSSFDFNRYSANYCESSMEYYGEKLSIYYPFLILTFIFFLHNQFSMGLVSLLALPLISMTTAPSVITGIFVFLSLAIIFKWVNSIIIYRIALYTILLGGFLFFFYQSGNLNMNFRIHEPILFYTNWGETGWFATKFFFAELWHRIKYSPFLTLFLYAPFVLVIAVRIAENKRNPSHPLLLPLILIICICVAGLTISGTIYKMNSSHQFYSNILTFVNTAINIGLLLILFPKKTTALSKISAGLVVALLLSKAIYAQINYIKNRTANNLYSENYLNQIKNIELDKPMNPVGVVLKPKEDYTTFVSKTMGGMPDGYLQFMPQFSTTVDLSLFEAIDSTSSDKNDISVLQYLPFFQFVQTQKKNHTFVSVSQSQIDFIMQYRIQYAILNKNCIVSTLLRKKIKTRINDPLSGQQFVLFR